MTVVGRVFKRDRLWWVAYYSERVAMTQLDHRTRSMFDLYKIFNDANPARTQ